jgi:hypothetical protein
MLSFVVVILVSASVLASAEDHGGVFVGHLKTKQHNTKGAVYAIDEKTIQVKNFHYDGTAPDAFFWVGKTGNIPSLDGTILPYPFTGKFFEYSDPNSLKLTGVFDGSKDITLTLPENLVIFLKVTKIIYKDNYYSAYTKTEFTLVSYFNNVFQISKVRLLNSL